MDEFYGFGIVDRNGKLLTPLVTGKMDIAEFWQESLNSHEPQREYRVVELFYKKPD